MGVKRGILGNLKLAYRPINMVLTAICRYKDYTKMLDRMIKQTNEAIAYLKKKRDKLED